MRGAVFKSRWGLQQGLVWKVSPGSRLSATQAKVFSTLKGRMNWDSQSKGVPKEVSNPASCFQLWCLDVPNEAPTLPPRWH